MAVIELFNGVHETQVAFLDQIEEVEGAIAAILFGDCDDQSEMSSHHFLARRRQRSLRAIHLGPHDPQVGDWKAYALSERREVVLQDLNPLRVLRRERQGPGRRQRTGGQEPMRIQLMPEITLKRGLAGDAAASRQLQQLLLDRFQRLPLALQLGEQIGELVRMQPQAVDLAGKAGKQSSETRAGALG